MKLHQLVENSNVDKEKINDIASNIMYACAINDVDEDGPEEIQHDIFNIILPYFTGKKKIEDVATDIIHVYRLSDVDEDPDEEEEIKQGIINIILK